MKVENQRTIGCFQVIPLSAQGTLKKVVLVALGILLAGGIASLVLGALSYFPHKTLFFSSIPHETILGGGAAFGSLLALALLNCRLKKPSSLPVTEEKTAQKPEGKTNPTQNASPTKPLSIKTTGGHFTPKKQFLANQFNPKNPSTIPLQTTAGEVPVWTVSVEDLHRIDLLINDTAPEIPATATSTEERSACVFNALLAACDNNLELAHGFAHLLHQGIFLDNFLPLAFRKGGAKSESEGDLQIGLSAKDNCFDLMIEKQNFTLSCEIVLLRYSMDDPRKNASFFKLKVHISGSLNDLENKACDKLSVHVLYTQEFKTLIAAKTAIYPSQEDPSLDCTSHFKIPSSPQSSLSDSH